MGDPQAPFSTVLAVLDRHGLLGGDGRLRDDVQLVSMGDHFDWGPPAERARATTDAIALVSWLAAHPPDQVVLLAGNHDLARVCELAPFRTDDDFEHAWRSATLVYRSGAPHPAEEAEFLTRFPHVPDAECLARDFSCFSTEQQRLVTELLRTGRFRLAWAHRGLLLVHAGVTLDDLTLVAAPVDDAHAVAAHLNAFFEARIAAWEGGPLELGPLHQPGSASGGVARGILFHRPARPAEPPDDWFHGPPRRRFDPRRLPPAFPQAIGHIRDKKCRELLGAWAAGGAAGDGPLRALTFAGDEPRYVRGTPPDARLYFLDGGMLHTSPERYELFDLDARRALSPARSG
ncbi:MAG: metallophosphoesterase [Myxococcota bacterium]